MYELSELAKKVLQNERIKPNENNTSIPEGCVVFNGIVCIEDFVDVPSSFSVVFNFNKEGIHWK